MPEGERDQKLESLGCPLDRTTAEGALFEPFVIGGECLELCGCLSPPFSARGIDR